MRRIAQDLISRAVLAQVATVRRSLARSGIQGDDASEIEQTVVWSTYKAARFGRVQWHDAGALRGFLRTLTRRAAWQWWKAHRALVEFQEHHEPSIASSEEAVLASSVIRILRESTTPERWRAVRSFALGTKVKDIAARERVPASTIYNRLRLARLDFEAAIAREEAIAQGPIVMRFRRLRKARGE